MPAITLNNSEKHITYSVRCIQSDFIKYNAKLHSVLTASKICSGFVIQGATFKIH